MNEKRQNVDENPKKNVTLCLFSLLFFVLLLLYFLFIAIGKWKVEVDGTFLPKRFGIPAPQRRRR